MLAIRKVTIEGFRSIRSAEIEARPSNVLIGPNGSGKSNFLEAFHLLHHIAAGRLQANVAMYSDVDELLHFGQHRTDSIFIKFDFSASQLGYYAAR
ncbi:MAG: AAA family ATPase, partial [Chloroflexi bacterium]|nr:AAA family ATPase [Chloroflexota bacterium]